jgi:hypothetical protein
LVRLQYVQVEKSLSELGAFQLCGIHQIQEVAITTDDKLCSTGKRKIDVMRIFGINRMLIHLHRFRQKLREGRQATD